MVNTRRIMGGVVIKKSLSQRIDNKQNNVMIHVQRPIKGGLCAQIGKKKSLSKVPFSLHTLEGLCRKQDVLGPKQSMKSIEIFNDEIMVVEMEDAFEEPVVDIDVLDTKNALAVVEYVDDIYANYRKMESYGMVSPNYMLTQQIDINKRMRATLIDWLIEVHHLCRYQHETLFLTVNIIDRFLAKQSVSRKKLQLVGMVAMLLACKYEEVLAPVVAYLIYISDKTYSRSEILEMENLMLHTLEFNISVPTPYVFLKRFLKAAQSDLKLDQMSSFLMDLCLLEYETLKFAPSLVAAASVYTAQCTLYGFKKWSKTCEWHSQYSQDQLLECSRMIVRYHQRAERGRLTAVYTKYNTSNFGYVATCEPAMFIADEIHQ